MNRFGSVMISAVLLSACASQIPEQLRSARLSDSPSVAEARSGGQRFYNAHVRWGGTIAAVENRASQTWIEVAPCQLNNDGRPGASDRGQNPFVARLKGNLDPAIYYKGRQLTVIGTLENRQSLADDEYAYEYPVVNVKTYHLWSPLLEGLGAYDAYSSWPSSYAPLVFNPLF